MPIANAYERAAVIGTIDPATIADTEVFTDVIDMRKFHQVMAIFSMGNMPAETIIARCVTCDSGGTNAAALKTATTLAAHATNNDNKQIVIAVRGEDLPGTSNADRYVKFGLVTGGSTGGPCSAVVLGMDPKHGPAEQFDLATVVEIEIDND
jgi:hypothetical protein